MTASRNPAAEVESVPMPAWEEGMIAAELSIGMLVEFTNLGWETPAQQKKLRGPWKVQEITAKRGSARSVGEGSTAHLVNGTGTRTRCAPSMLKRSTLPWVEVETAQVVDGSVVRFTEAGAKRVRGGKISPADLFVVLKVKGDDVALAKLGGDAGRYYPTIPRAILVAVHGESVAIP